MNEIQLLYVGNVVSRNEGMEGQELEFLIRVMNIAYDKQVDVLWSGRDGVWKTLRAGFFGPAGENGEWWRAQATFRGSDEGGLPGTIRFALRYRVAGREYWDNNDSRDYQVEADSGIWGRESFPLVHVGFNPLLPRGWKVCPVTIAVHRSLHARRVGVVWTTDGWKTKHQTRCRFQKDYWGRTRGSRAGNPNGYGWSIWAGELPIDDAYRVEYAVFSDSGSGREKIWDNNFGINYLARRESLKILTLNLHCYQEEDQDAKFDRIARAVRDLKIDIVCLQEVGEHWNDGRGDWKSNAARIIRERLRRCYHLSYHLHTDWSHIGFDRYREGVAILSRYRFLAKSSGYVSRSSDVYSIHSRKVVMARVHVPYMGLVNIFSAHLSWWDDGFREQFENLRRWADGEHDDGLGTTFLCGDFNIKAGSQGYATVVGTKHYEDQFLKATSRRLFDKIYNNNDHDRSSRDLEGLLAKDHRIDYIFMKKGGSLKATSGRVLFTQRDYGRVSDHEGYLLEFEPK